LDEDVPVVFKSASELAGIVAGNPLVGSGLRERTAAGVLQPRVVGSKLAADRLPASIR
jgi:hypothetical protein